MKTSYGKLQMTVNYYDHYCSNESVISKQIARFSRSYVAIDFSLAYQWKYKLDVKVESKGVRAAVFNGTCSKMIA